MMKINKEMMKINKEMKKYKKENIILSIFFTIMVIGAGIWAFRAQNWDMKQPILYNQSDLDSAIETQLNHRINGTLAKYENVSMYKIYQNQSSRLVISLYPKNFPVTTLKLSFIPNNQIESGEGVNFFDSESRSWIEIPMNPQKEGWLYFYVRWGIDTQEFRQNSSAGLYELEVNT